MDMDAARWTAIEAHFHRLADRPFAEQSVELDGMAASDPGLAAAVRAMLDADASGRTLLDRSPGAVAHAMLDDGARLPSVPFGPYRLVSLLGEGGMGVVYLGERADINARAAIKVLRDAWLSPSRRDRFLSEQRTLASLEHPGIARLLDADRLEDGTPWFAMEYVDGEPATDYVVTRRLSLAERLALFRQVSDAVRYAHERGVIHRDIKPGNVLVGRERQLKLLDFGIAKTLNGTHRATDATRTQHRLLTPAYASPEQLRGEPLGVQTDVFSLGILLFEMLSGTRPFMTEGLSTAEAAAQIEAHGAPRVSTVLRKRDDGAVSLDRVGRGTIDDLDALAACALHPDRARRYRSVDALLADLARFERREPLAAQPDSASYRLRKFMARRWREAAAVLAVVLTGTIAATAYAREIRSARDLALNESARVTRQQEFLMSLFQGGASAEGDPASMPTRTLVSNGRRELESLANDPLMQAEMFATIGTLSRAINDTLAADTLLREAIWRKSALLGEQAPDVLRSRIEYAALLEQRADAHGAVAELRQVRELALRHTPEDHPVRAEVNEALGRLLATLGETSEGLPLIEDAVRYRKAHDASSREYAVVLRLLAENYFHAQKLDSAARYLRDAVDATRRIYGNAHPELAYALLSLATVDRFDGRFVDAERAEREGKTVLANWFGPSHAYAAGARINYGGTLAQLQRYREAVDEIRPAVDDLIRQMGPDFLTVGSAFTTMGLAYEGMGSLDSSLLMRARALRIYEKALGETHVQSLRERELIAGLNARLNRVAVATELQRELLAVAERRFGSDDASVAAFRVQLGRYEWQLGRAQQAIATLESGLRSLIPTTELMRRRWAMGAQDLASAHAAAGNGAVAERWRAAADSARRALSPQ